MAKQPPRRTQPAQDVAADVPGRWKSRLAIQVFERLRDDIVRCVLPPGTHMSELDICDTMHVSRTPVREALIRLVEDDLVEVIPQRGTFVAPISMEAVREGQFVREHLECAMVMDAARRMTPEIARRVSDNMAQQRHAARRLRTDEFHALDNAFHNMIAEISGHPSVWQIIHQVKTHFDRVRQISLLDPAHLPKLIAQHEAVATALVAGDPRKAEKALRRHLREVLYTIDKLGETGVHAAVPPSRRRSPRKRRTKDPI